MTPRLTIAGVLACLLVASAQAQTPPAGRPGPQEQAVLQQACGGDFLQFCAGIDPNSPAVEACFERNKRNLSPACGQAIQSYQARAKAR